MAWPKRNRYEPEPEELPWPLNTIARMGPLDQIGCGCLVAIIIVAVPIIISMIWR